MKITAVIPIRKGSLRVPNKNLKDFCGTTLLDNKIKTLLEISEIDEIIVNTDSEEAILKVIEYNNPKLKYHKRELYYASSECSGSEFFKHLGETTDTDIFIYVPCTSPFITKDTIKKCILLYLKKDDTYDSVSTVSTIKEFLWQDNKPLNYDPLHAPNSLNLPNIVALNFGCSIIDKNTLFQKSNIIGYTPKFIVTEGIECIDIDTPLDFMIAEVIYKNLQTTT